jgi:hypothetical protein
VTANVVEGEEGALSASEISPGPDEIAGLRTRIVVGLRDGESWIICTNNKNYLNSDSEIKRI